MLFLQAYQVEVFELSHEHCVYPYSVNTYENHWHMLLPNFFLSHRFPYTDIFLVSQEKYLERSPRPFVNLSLPSLEQIPCSIFVFSKERWFPRGFKASGLVQTTFSHLAEQHQLGSGDICIYLIKRRASADSFVEIHRLHCG